MVDFDLAQLFRIETKTLNRAVRRNPLRFPEDFMLRPTPEEESILRCQFGTSSSGHGGRRYPPLVFTEHGIVMLASILNSESAIQASVQVVRVFMRLREMLAAHKELGLKIQELERRVDGHDTQIRSMFEVMQNLTDQPPPDPPRQIGFKPD